MEQEQGMTAASPIVTDIQTKMEVTLNKEDIVAISVADFEKRLHDLEKEFRKKIKSTQDQRKSVAEKLEVDWATLKDETGNRVSAAMKEALKIGGYVVSQFQVERNDELKDIAVLAIHILLKKEEPFAPLTAPAKGRSNYISTLAADTFEKVALPSTIIHGTRDVEELDKQEQKLKQGLLEVMKRLSDIPALERATRAQVARKALERSSNGAALLSALDGVANFGDIQSLEDILK